MCNFFPQLTGHLKVIEKHYIPQTQDKEKYTVLSHWEVFRVGFYVL